MSEPFSLMLNCTVAPQALHNFLHGPLLPPEAVGDWNDLGIILAPSDFELSRRLSSGTPAAYLRDMRRYARQDMAWHFAFNRDTGQLSCASLMWTGHWPEIVAGLYVLRQIAAHTAGASKGYLLVHDFAFETHGTAAAVLLSGGRSAVLDPDAKTTESIVEHARPTAIAILDTARAAFEMDPPVASDSVMTDQFDLWMKGGA
jgi:hypothetical protein